MTTIRIPLHGSFRALAASHRRGHLPGGAGSTTIDRDLDRIAFDLQAVSQVDPERLAKASRALDATVEHPVDLHGRRRRHAQPKLPTTSTPAPQARAS